MTNGKSVFQGRSIPCAQIAAVSIGVLLGVLSATETASAGIVLGPGGHLPFGGSSRWETHGQNYSLTTDSWTPWGDDNVISVDPWEHTLANSTTHFRMHNIMGTTGNASGPVKLSAATIVNGFDLGPGINRVRSWTTAVLNDRVRVTAGGGFAGGRIKLEWEVDGGLTFYLDSESGAPLGVPQGFFWAHSSEAEVFAAWQEAGQVVTVDQSIGQISGYRSGSSLSAAQRGALEYLDQSQTKSAFHQFPNQEMFWEDPHPVPKTGVFTSGVPMLPGQLMPVMLGLGTFTNVLWDLLDYGGLTSGIASNFNYTAELKGVRLFNMDGSPYTGQWELYSENGYDYPEVYATIPEPDTLLLLGLGMLGFAWRRKSA